MLDMGFVHDVKKVIAKLPAKRQNLMFSATMPKEIEQLAAGILHNPAFVKVDPVSSTVERIDQSLYFVEKGNKKLLLPWLIKNPTRRCRMRWCSAAPSTARIRSPAI